MLSAACQITVAQVSLGQCPEEYAEIVAKTGIAPA